MKTRPAVGLLLVCSIAAGIAASAGSAVAKMPGVVLVARDPAGDWGSNHDPALAPVGDATGSDLVEGLIWMIDKKTLGFTIRVNQLPGSGGIPEGMRYIWSGTINGDYFELDGKFTNYTRGACDPTAGSCPPVRDPGSAPFVVRGDCEITDPSGANSVSTCKELGIVHAEFNVDTGAINIPVPLPMLGAKAGSKIGAGFTEFTDAAGGPIIVTPSAFLSNGGFPNDSMRITRTFVVPRR